MPSYTTISSNYSLTCSGYLKTSEITKLAHEYKQREGLSGKFPRGMKAVCNAVYIFPKKDHSFLEIQKLDNMDQPGAWKWSKVNSKKVEGGTSAT